METINFFLWSTMFWSSIAVFFSRSRSWSEITIWLKDRRTIKIAKFSDRDRKNGDLLSDHQCFQFILDKNCSCLTQSRGWSWIGIALLTFQRHFSKPSIYNFWGEDSEMKIHEFWFCNLKISYCSFVKYFL